MELNTFESNASQIQDPRILAASYMMFKIGEALNKFYIPILVPIGLVGNFLSFLVMVQPHNRHMSISLYISALAVSDTMAILISIPNYLNQVHDIDMLPNQFWYCGIMIFMVVSSFLCSTYLLIAMTFERFYSIIQPHKAASFNTIRKTKFTIICVFVLCFSYSFPFVVIGSNNGRFCIPNRFASDNVLGELYYWLTEIITFIFPFISLLIMNSVIIHTLRKRSSQNILGSAVQDENDGHNVKIKHPEKQIFTMLLLVTFVFLALNTPTHLLVFYLNFFSGTTPYYYAGLHLFYQIGHKMYYTNHGVNFFLYVMSGQRFRTDLKNLFISKKSKRDKHLVSNVNTITSSVN